MTLAITDASHAEWKHFFSEKCSRHRAKRERERKEKKWGWFTWLNHFSFKQWVTWITLRVKYQRVHVWIDASGTESLDQGLSLSLSLPLSSSCFLWWVASHTGNRLPVVDVMRKGKVRIKVHYFLTKNLSCFERKKEVLLSILMSSLATKKTLLLLLRWTWLMQGCFLLGPICLGICLFTYTWLALTLILSLFYFSHLSLCAQWPVASGWCIFHIWEKPKHSEWFSERGCIISFIQCISFQVLGMHNARAYSVKRAKEKF